MSQVIAIRDDSPHQVLCVHQAPEHRIAGLEAPPPRSVISAGLRGARGAPGEPGPAGGSAFQRIAGETLSALRVVYELNNQVFYLDLADTANIDQLLGVTLNAASPGAEINVQRSGIMDDNAWNWALGRIWLGVNGTLTQTPATQGFDVLIGYAVSPTRIILNIQDPILLED